jgi:chlorobactene glucosyltransferase
VLDRYGPMGLAPDLSIWAALALAIVTSALFLRARFHYLAIPPLSIKVRNRAPDCMVVIPARNEEPFVARAIRSLPADTVVMVDDHSEDHTAEVARKAGAGVVQAPELPRRAVGKSNACLAGARALVSKWILFADADTWYEAGFLEAVVGHAEANGLAFLSIYLQPAYEIFQERLLMPFASALFFCGVSPRGDPAAIFNGQCLLVRREAYQFIGGHATVLNALNEDVKLAALAQRHRLNLGVARTNLGSVHLREPRQMVVRGSFRFLTNAWSGLTIFLAAMSMALWLPVLAWLLVDRHWAIAIAFASLPALLTVSWYRNARAVLMPVAIYVMLPILFDGLMRAVTSRRVTWKGRVI